MTSRCEEPRSREVVIFEGIEFKTKDYPLEFYLESLTYQPVIGEKGYYGTWLVKEGKLFLTKLLIFSHDNSIKYDIEYIFPGEQIVFASWFTGAIRITLPYIAWGKDKSKVDLYKDLGLIFEDGVLSNMFIENLISGKRYGRLQYEDENSEDSEFQ